jgi:gluconokinase
LSRFVLAIDIGTTSTKVLAVTAQGEVLCSHQEFYPTYFPLPDHVEQHAAHIRKAVMASIHRVVTLLPAPPLVLSMSCAMHSFLVVDEDGLSHSPVLIWSDTRSYDQAQSLYQSSLGKMIAQRSGTPIHPMSPLCKIKWWTTQHPVRPEHRFVSIKEYLLYHLTGLWAVDHSLASATGLFDIQHNTWMQESLEWAGIDRKQLSEPVPTTTFLSLTPAACTNLGLPQSTQLMIGASDGCLAHHAFDLLPNEWSLTVGTSGAVRLSQSTPLIHPEGKIFNYVLTHQKFVSGGATNHGTVLIDWFNQNIAKKAVPADLFTSVLTNYKPGSNGLLFLPYILGERAPFYDANARGAWIGLGIRHTLEDMQQALLEGMCFEINSIIQMLSQIAQAPTKLVMSGGLTRSSAWVQLLCDITQVPIEIRHKSDASSLGAARLAFEALSVSYQDSSVDVQLFTPSNRYLDIHQKLMAMFVETTQRLTPVFHSLAHWQRS